MLLLQVAMNEPVVGETSREKRKIAAMIMRQTNSDIQNGGYSLCIAWPRFEGKANISVVSSLFTRW